MMLPTYIVNRPLLLLTWCLLSLPPAFFKEGVCVGGCACAPGAVKKVENLDLQRHTQIWSHPETNLAQVTQISMRDNIML